MNKKLNKSFSPDYWQVAADLMTLVAAGWFVVGSCSIEPDLALGWELKLNKKCKKNLMTCFGCKLNFYLILEMPCILKLLKC